MGWVVMQHVPHEFCGYHMLSPLSYYTILSLPELPIITFSTSFFLYNDYIYASIIKLLFKFLFLFFGTISNPNYPVTYTLFFGTI